MSLPMTTTQNDPTPRRWALRWRGTLTRNVGVNFFYCATDTEAERQFYLIYDKRHYVVLSITQEEENA